MAVVELVAAFDEVAARRRLEINIDQRVDPDATGCDPGIVRLLEGAIEAHGYPVVRLTQGMATDAANMASIGPIGLALIRCRDAVGWGPADFVHPADVEIGLNALTSVVGALASYTDAPSFRRT
ncbi:hypothetical protein MFUR16E_12735 [Methylobacterium fujisawaense]